HTALGEYAEALEALQKGHALGRLRGDAWHYSSAQWVESAKRMVDLADRLLPAIERGEAGLPVEDPQAMILRELEAVARTRGRGVALTKAYQELLASAGPQTHPNLFLRAACAALIPAAVNPSQSTSLGYRQLASRWLRESLTRCRMAAEAGVLPRGVAALMITDSLADPGLDPIREGAGLDELPEAERAHWIERWDEARAIASALAD
ncbi:MAG: hypothetical protein KDB53_11275, partial [Planctomycetes bacterium]|nr:hypothetical protein [Planctomycetota bacterium]